MANFGQLVLTAQGTNALLQAQAGEELKFSKIAMGEGVYTGNINTVTQLVDEVARLDILRGTVNAGTKTYTVEAHFSNEEITSGFQWREIGLFIEDADGEDVLYAYANSGALYDYIPATTDERYSKYIRIVTSIDNAANVTIIAPPDALFVDYETYNEDMTEVMEVINNLRNHTHTAEDVGARPNTWTPTANDVGAPPVIDAKSTAFDMDIIFKSGTHFAFYITDENTKGTPANKGVTSWNNALILSYVGKNTAFGMQVAYVHGLLPYIRQMVNGEIKEWGTGFLPLTGGTLTGNLYLKDLDNTSAETARIFEYAKSLYLETSLNSSYSRLEVKHPNNSDLANSLRYGYVKEGSSFSGNIYGEHNTELLATKLETLIANGGMSTLQSAIQTTSAVIEDGKTFTGTGKGKLFVHSDSWVAPASITIDGKNIGAPSYTAQIGAVEIEFLKSFEVKSLADNTTDFYCVAVFY